MRSLKWKEFSIEKSERRAPAPLIFLEEIIFLTELTCSYQIKIVLIDEILIKN